MMSKHSTKSLIWLTLYQYLPDELGAEVSNRKAQINKEKNLRTSDTARGGAGSFKRYSQRKFSWETSDIRTRSQGIVESSNGRVK